MKTVIGLGNPGERYKNTRHNIGFIVLEKLKTEMLKKYSNVFGEIHDLDFRKETKFKAELLRIEDVLLVKPQTFMNESGKTVSLLAKFYKIPASDIYVIHDDLDLILGEYKIQKGIGPKLHYGVESVEKYLGSKDFWRIRVGIENRDLKSGSKIRGEDYVLQPFTSDEYRILSATSDKIVLELIG